MPVDTIDVGIIKLIKNMELAMRVAQGVGLAANQIGYSKRLFIYKDGLAIVPIINPVLTAVEHDNGIWGQEGCLSIPGKSFTIQRPTKLVMDYLDVYGNERTLIAHGELARCIMHEMDHLEGRLISDY